MISFNQFWKPSVSFFWLHFVRLYCHPINSNFDPNSV